VGHNAAQVGQNILPVNQNLENNIPVGNNRVDYTVDENTKLLLRHIKSFNGTSEDLQQWTTNWNLIMPLAGLTPNKQIVHFAAKLVGPALEWYRRLLYTQENNIPWNIEALIQVLRTQFAHLNTLYYDYMKFKLTIQRNNSVDAYAAKFQEMLNQTKANMTDTLEVVSFVNGLKNKI